MDKRLPLVALLLGVAAGVTSSTTLAQGPAPTPVLLQTSDAQRQQYLANAVIWETRPLPTPDQLRAGPPGRNPVASLEVNAAGEIPCSYLQGGVGATGKTAKFTCRTEDGRRLRVKYYDGNVRTGNREVFAEVASTRLFWALGFDADAMYPVTVRCSDCPSNPMTGQGARASRRYLGVVEAFYDGTIITSGSDNNEGWTFGEVAAAIARLPPERRQVHQMHFDALSLLAAIVQHGDRKPSQQRLVCRTPLDVAAGDLHAVDDENGLQVAALYERDGAQACSRSMLTIQDLGATLGNAGQFTLNVSSKAHLSTWAPLKVFAFSAVKAFERPACHASITVSNTAGPGGMDDPRIGEAGRRLLHTVMSAMTPAHVRAIFEAARLDAIDERQTWRDPSTGRELTGIDAWVGAFLHKVEELGATQCPA